MENRTRNRYPKSDWALVTGICGDEAPSPTCQPWILIGSSAIAKPSPAQPNSPRKNKPQKRQKTHSPRTFLSASFFPPKIRSVKSSVTEKSTFRSKRRAPFKINNKDYYGTSTEISKQRRPRKPHSAPNLSRFRNKKSGFTRKLVKHNKKLLRLGVTVGGRITHSRTRCLAA